MPLVAGARMGAYEILGPLGAGGMGEVYLARDTRLDRRVALKVLPSRMDRDTQAIGSFRHEALALASLNHPNIAIIHGFEELDGGQTILVMEMVEGETLSARLARGRMSVEEALQIGAQIAEALEVAHERGVVHRDVKPGNVMIGPRGLVKVLDFGLARRTTGLEGVRERSRDATHEERAPAGDDAPLTPSDEAPTLDLRAATRAETDSLEGMIVGTPGYMSPEQVLARRTDARSDVFAVGSVLYECLAGQRAFAGPTPHDRMRATVSDVVEFTRLPSDVPARIRDLIARSLEKEPDARPPDMRTVRVTLEDALGIRRAAALREGAAYPTPNNLPAATTSFVGREDVLRESERRLGEARLLTLLGMGGAGKTRIAQRLADSALARYPDGVWFLNLAPVTDDAHVVDVAADALGLEDEPGRSPLDVLVRHVRDRKMLFVVDNCEHVIPGARGLVAGLLAGSSLSRVLATSREPLTIDGEAVFPLPALATPDAGAGDVGALMSVESVRLFVERARASQSDFTLTAENAPDVVEICRRLDGIPLAIELAAARVRMLGVTQIRARLGDRFKLLTRPGDGGASRQHTVLATIQWSWDHLLPPEQDLMRRLAVFAGGWTLERATAVVSDRGDEFEVLDLLTRLVERSLVVVERHASIPTRYRFLESVLQFVREKLEAHPDHALMRERHLDAYLTLAKAAGQAMMGPGAMQQIAELKLEEENVLAALAWCDHAPDGPRRGLVLAESMARFWSVLGRQTLGRRVLEDLIQRNAGNPPSSERARAHTRAAGFALTLGDVESARTHLEASLAFWRSSGESSGLPATLAGLGVVAMYQKRFEDALSLAEESLALYEQRGQTRGVAMVLHNIGSIEHALGRPDHGRAHLEHALTLLREVGDQTTEALCLTALVSTRVRCGDRRGALAAMQECFGLFLTQVESPREEVFSLDSLAELMAAEGREFDAARFLGVGEAARVALKMPYMPFERDQRDTLVRRLRAKLSPEEFDRGIATGRGQSVKAALAEGKALVASIATAAPPAP